MADDEERKKLTPEQQKAYDQLVAECKEAAAIHVPNYPGPSHYVPARPVFHLGTPSLISPKKGAP